MKRTSTVQRIVKCVFLLFVVCLLLYGFYQERCLNTQIEALQSENTILKDKIEKLENQIASLSEKTEGVFYWRGQYNYLAIGNSITLHGKADYWWNKNGMAASSEEKDYVHLVQHWLADNKGPDVYMLPYNFAAWELQSHDRAETLAELDKYLSKEIDLVTVQLSENVTDLSTYENDYRELVKYLIEKCPNAQIMIIDDFWDNGTKSEVKKLIADEYHIDFVDLSEIKDRDEYKCGLGTTVYGADGAEHIVEHNGVAKHPGDKGMKYIADSVIGFVR